MVCHNRVILMKQSLLVTLIIVLFIITNFMGCFKNESNNGGSDEDEKNDDSLIYRHYMREFVQNISEYGKGKINDFIIIPQNGHDIMTEDGMETGTPVMNYLNATDGAGQEDLFYGYDEDNKATLESEREFLLAFLKIAEDNGVEVLVTDYCSDHDKMDDSYEKNAANNFISFAADHRELDNIPTYPMKICNVNNNDITSLADAKNFLYLINPEQFASKEDFLNSVQQTDYDIVIIDMFYEDSQLTNSDVESLKQKANGGSRLIISYMSIGEAEDYRYYWNTAWTSEPPSWLAEENPEWPGNYKVCYWEEDWQNIIYGSETSYLDRIINAGFDGVYLDIIEAFEYFER